jgi:hypothetical protein
MLMLGIRDLCFHYTIQFNGTVLYHRDNFAFTLALNIVTCKLWVNRVNSGSVCLQPLLGNEHDVTVETFV